MNLSTQARAFGTRLATYGVTGDVTVNAAIDAFVFSVLPDGAIVSEAAFASLAALDAYDDAKLRLESLSQSNN